MTDIFIKEIKRMILTEELAIGEKLPPEREIAEAMGVSLAVVNAGITRMCEMGFLRVIQRKGVYVEDYLKNGTVRTLTEILDFTDHSIDDDLLDVIVHVRKSMEEIIFRRVCEIGTESVIEELLGNVEQTKETADVETVAELNYEFLHIAAINCGSPYYTMFIQTFRDMYLFFGRYSLVNKIYTKEWMCNYETEIIQVLRDGDITKIREIVSSSIDTWRESFRKSNKYKGTQR